MVRSQGRSKRTQTGGRRRPKRKKRKHELAGYPSLTSVGSRKTKEVRKQGGSKKTKALQVDEASVQMDDGTSEEAEIQDVVENPADPHYVRRNVLNRGAVIETSAGKARVTNRPSQEGCVNAVLLDE